MYNMSKLSKRNLDLLVLSDVHLGTRGCRADELLLYLKSIKPKQVVLNGDILDMWQFNKNYWPKNHMKIISLLFKWLVKGIKITYITGNHDEVLRKFEGLKLGNFEIQNKVVLEIDQKKAWIFHGDIFDVTMQHSRWLVKLGGIGYDLLIQLNRLVNAISKLVGKGRISLSKKIKNSVKSAVKYINHFEETATEIAARNKFDFVVCGHIHQPQISKYHFHGREVLYLNSGDWIENLTSLEYHHGQWRVYQYNETELLQYHVEEELESVDLEFLAGQSSKQIFKNMLVEMLQLNL
mgnify:CR=1 FL=1